MAEDMSVGGKRRLRLRASSPRRGSSITLLIPEAAGLETISVAGVPALDRPQPAWPGWHILTLRGLPPGGYELQVVLANPGPQEWYVMDRRVGLPPSGQILEKARPATSTPFQDGDATLISRKVRI